MILAKSRHSVWLCVKNWSVSMSGRDPRTVPNPCCGPLRRHFLLLVLQTVKTLEVKNCSTDAGGDVTTPYSG